MGGGPRSRPVDPSGKRVRHTTTRHKWPGFGAFGASSGTTQGQIRQQDGEQDEREDTGQTIFLVFSQPPAGVGRFHRTKGGKNMLWLILFIIIVLVVFGLGFFIKALFWVALALFIVWLISLIVSLFRR
jgi:hypothetical protein